MTINKEFQLVQNIPSKKPMSKLVWVNVLFFSLLSVYFIYKFLYDVAYRDSLLIFIMIFATILIIQKTSTKKNTPHLFITIKDNNLYITDETATFWLKPISEITEIIVEEPIIKWKVTVRSKSLMFKTKNDSYGINLDYLKFTGYDLSEAVMELKSICNL